MDESVKNLEKLVKNSIKGSDVDLPFDEWIESSDNKLKSSDRTVKSQQFPSAVVIDGSIKSSENSIKSQRLPSTEIVSNGKSGQIYKSNMEAQTTKFRQEVSQYKSGLQKWLQNYNVEKEMSRVQKEYGKVLLSIKEDVKAGDHSKSHDESGIDIITDIVNGVIPIIG
jgi:hypothetical protein